VTLAIPHTPTSIMQNNGTSTGLTQGIGSHFDPYDARSTRESVTDDNTTIAREGTSCICHPTSPSRTRRYYFNGPMYVSSGLPRNHSLPYDKYTQKRWLTRTHNQTIFYIVVGKLVCYQYKTIICVSSQDHSETPLPPDWQRLVHPEGLPFFFLPPSLDRPMVM
jgi:hypothetical protein